MRRTHTRGGYDLRAANRFMTARRRQVWWRSARRRIKQELLAYCPRWDREGLA